MTSNFKKNAATKIKSVSDLTDDALRVFVSPAKLTVISASHPTPAIVRDLCAPPPRYDLIHYTISLCSQKVRTTLNELKCTYGSDDLIIMENWIHYRPEYLKLRLRSEAARNTGLVSGYSGISSVEKEGLDPLVVPTLVDHNTGKVLADSKQICLYLADQHSAVFDLVPDDIATQVLSEIDNVDRTPHVALLYGANPDGDCRPDGHKSRFSSIHQRKIAALQNHLQDVSDQPPLQAAYKAKIAKETAAAKFVVDATAMREAIRLTHEMIAQLEDTLARSGGPWLFGERFTLADIVWGVSLIRLNVLGYGVWLENPSLSGVQHYAERLRTRQSLRHAILEWDTPTPESNVQTAWT